MCNLCLGSPCYAATGAYTSNATDLAMPTVGLPLQVWRSYESARPIDGPVGIGWTLNLSTHLYYATYLFAAPSTYQKEADIVTATGARYRFVENADGSFAPPAFRYDALVKNGDGSFDFTVADGGTKYHFASDGSVQSIADEFGNALTFTYEANGRLQRVADAAGSGRYLDLFYGADGRVNAIQDHTGRRVEYAYDSRGVLTTATDALARNVSYTYQQVRFAPLLTRIADHWGRVITDVTYDAQGRTQTYTDNGETYTYTYNYNGRADQSSKVDSAGNRWVYTYGADGPIVQRDFPAAASQQVVYNADKSIQMVTDEVGVKTFYTYAGQGRLGSVTRDYQGPLAVRFDYTYDPNFPRKITSILPRNPATSANDPNWQGWEYEYYQAGSAAPGALWHVYRLHDNGTTRDTVATYEYDSRGRVTAMTSATGGRTDYTYDASGNLATVTAPPNNDAGTRPVTTYGHDVLGRATSLSDALNHATTYTYDAADRILTVTVPKPSSSSTLDFTTQWVYDTYDSATQLLSTTTTDPNGNVTAQKYDLFGRLAKVVDAQSNTTTHTYTRALLTSITDANGYTTSYAYDALARLTRTTFPDTASETYAYFPDGLLQSRMDRKYQTIQFGYDHLKRPITKTYPNSTGVSHTYQGQNLTQVADTSVTPNENHTFTYDSVLRVTSNTQGSRGTIGYTYDAADRPASYSVTGGPSATYAYYADGSLNTIQWTPVTGQFKYAYILTGQYSTITFPNGQARSYAYDDQGRLTQLANVHSTAGNLATYAYGYDLNNATGANTMLGQRTNMTATVPFQNLSSSLTKYYYDAAYQLTRVDYPSAAPFNGEVHSWTYDAIGNRLTNTVNGATQTSSYQKLGSNPNNWHRLASDGTNSYSYDANGNTATRTGFTFGWNYDNAMTSITGTPSVTYTYDYSGRRSSKSVSGTGTGYLYDGANLIVEAGGGSMTYHLFGSGIDEPLASSRGASVVYHAVDGLGSVAIAADTAAVPQSSYTYDAWGVGRSTSEVFVQPFRYTAREADDSAGALAYRARYYSPFTGRFFSEDPLPRWFERWHGFIAEGVRPYIYADNQASQRRDPSGLKSCGPYPKPTGRCAADTIARHEWSLCALNEKLSLASNLDTYVLTGVIGAIGGTVAGRSLPGTCIGAAIGVAAGVVYSQHTFPAAEQAIINATDNALKQCKQDACMSGHPPNNLCTQSLQ